MGSGPAGPLRALAGTAGFVAGWLARRAQGGSPVGESRLCRQELPLECLDCNVGLERLGLATASLLSVLLAIFGAYCASRRIALSKKGAARVEVYDLALEDSPGSVRSDLSGAITPYRPHGLGARRPSLTEVADW